MRLSGCLPALRRRAERERGAMSVAIVPVAVLLMATALIVISMFGSATGDRREATTAADAAALAAAQEWDRQLGNVFDLHIGVGEHVGFWELAGSPILRANMHQAMRTQAESFAARNGADLLAMHVDPQRRTVSVEVRHHDAVNNTDTRLGAEATAEIELTGGLCAVGGRLGYLIDGSCVTAPAPEPPDPPEPPDDEDEDEDTEDEEDEEPFEPPAIGVYRSEVVLAR